VFDPSKDQRGLPHTLHFPLGRTIIKTISISLTSTPHWPSAANISQVEALVEIDKMSHSSFFDPHELRTEARPYPSTPHQRRSSIVPAGPSIKIKMSRPYPNIMCHQASGISQCSGRETNNTFSSDFSINSAMQVQQVNSKSIKQYPSYLPRPPRPSARSRPLAHLALGCPECSLRPSNAFSTTP